MRKCGPHVLIPHTVNLGETLACHSLQSWAVVWHSRPSPGSLGSLPRHHPKSSLYSSGSQCVITSHPLNCSQLSCPVQVSVPDGALGNPCQLGNSSSGEQSSFPPSVVSTRKNLVPYVALCSQQTAHLPAPKSLGLAAGGRSHELQD